MNQQQKPKQNFLQTMLIMMCVVFGAQMMMGQCNGNKPGVIMRKPDEISADIRATALYTADSAFTQYLGDYEKVLQAAKTPSSEMDQRTLTAKVIVRAKQLKYAQRLGPEKKTDAFNRVTAVYTALYAERDKFGHKPLWDMPVEIEYPDLGEKETITPRELYDRSVDELGVRNKTELVWGFAPGYQMIDTLVKLTNKVPSFSYAFAAFILAVLVRLAIWPLAQKQLRWGRQMSQLQPYIKELQEKYKDKRTGKVENMQELQAETMKLYQSYGISPMAGCLPMFVQLPLFLLVYQCMLHYRFEFLNGHFLWVHPGAGSFLGIPLGANLGERDYILIIIYGISMIVTTLMMPVSDPTQVRQQKIMGLSMSVMFGVMMFWWPVPSAFILYWIFTNILSTAQTLYSYKMHVPAPVKVNAPHGAVIPVDPKAKGTTPQPGTTLMGKTGTPKTGKPKKRRK